MRTDTLGRRLRFASPQPRGKRLDLSERDFLIFEALLRHGPLPTHYLYEFTRHLGKHLTSLQHRLTKLANGTENGPAYLVRPPQQFAAYNGRCQPLIYDLTPSVFSVLAEHGNPHPRPRTDPFMHRFMTACVSASIQLAALAGGCRYGSKEDIFAHPKCPEPTRNASNPLALPIWSGDRSRFLVPDDLFVIQYPGPKARFFAVEIDRRTESIHSETAKTAFGRKLQAYIAAIKNRTYHGHWGIPGLTVLTITTNAVHLRQMLRHLHALNEPQLSSRFLFKSKSHFSANWEVPPIMGDLFGEPWVAGDGSQVAIDAHPN
jgi:hypothetical protein